MRRTKGSPISVPYALICFAGVVAASFVGGCGTPHLTYLTVAPGRTSIALGDTAKFTVVANYSDGTTEDVTASACMEHVELEHRDYQRRRRCVSCGGRNRDDYGERTRQEWDSFSHCFQGCPHSNICHVAHRADCARPKRSTAGAGYVLRQKCPGHNGPS